MDKIIQKLTNIEAWIDFNLPPRIDTKTNAEFMRFVAEVMNRCLYLLRIGVASAPDAETAKIGYPQPKAIIAGHLVQLTKLYEGALIQICGAQPELTRLFFHPILEVARNTEHLIVSSGQFEHGDTSGSYPTEIQTLRELKADILPKLKHWGS